jgi:hypothetical protein
LLGFNSIIETRFLLVSNIYGIVELQSTGFLEQKKAGHKQKQSQQIEISEAEGARELKKQRDGENQREIEPRCRIGQVKIKENRLVHGCLQEQT